MRRSSRASRRWTSRAVRAGHALRRLVLLGRLAAGAPAARAAAEEARSPAPGGSPAVRFVDVARRAGVVLANVCGGSRKDYINETVGNGVCLGDVDDDGHLDIFLPNGLPGGGVARGRMPRSALYRNRGDGTFEDVTERAGVALRGYWAQGCVFGDYDDDGRLDLFVTGFGRYYLYRNLGDGRFADVTAFAGLEARGWSTGAAFGDYDGDGWIDLFVSHYVDYDASSPPLPEPGAGVNCFYRGMPVMCGPRGLKRASDRLYRNLGNGRFRDVTRQAGVGGEPPGFALGAFWSDLDLDGDLDLYVANDATANLLYRNDGDGRFTEIGTIAGVAYNEDGRAQSSMGVDVGDYDNDGRPDIFVTNFSHDYSTLYRGVDRLFFLDATRTAGLGTPTLRTLGWGTGFIDYDNDGHRDIFIANGHVYPGIDGTNLGTTWKQRDQLFHNDGRGRFRETTDEAGPAFRQAHSSRGAAFGDLDNDGDIDIVVNNMDEPPSLLRNDGGNARSWIGFRLLGAPPNRAAIGARVTVVAGATRQTGEVRAGASHISCNDPRLHFGLGALRRADRVEIRWPRGTTQVLTDLPAGRYHTIREPRGG
ncbi:MAG: CRTAC1 family protein [Acidobacteriota bacterium]